MFDFTTESDRNIIAKVATEQNICGRFLPSQLNRPLLQPAARYPRYLSAIAAFIGVFSVQVAAAQEEISGDTVIVERIKGVIMGKMRHFPANRVSGIVTLDGMPVQGVAVSVDGDLAQCYTNENGFFDVPFHDGATLIFTHEKFQTKALELSVNPNRVLEVKLEKKKTPIYVLGGLGATGLMINRTSRKRSAWQRIKSLFK
ncbi:MAG: hypothetical protein EOO01_40300 [Chitinophagaceae bacterium]|nr:MAG: hypothetical protein EOO01_40300 [Chitinophagaceae bacterium]